MQAMLRGIFVVAVGVLVATAAAAADPAVVCHSGKLKVTGKYGACRLSAESKAVKTGDPVDYTKCNETFSTKFGDTEIAAGPGVCVTEGDELPIQSFVDDCAQRIATALAGGTLDTCASGTGLAACQSDCVASVRPPLRTGQNTCYNSSGSVITCPGTGQDGELQKGAARSFTDNGDGTVTDNSTSLMWEKLSDDGTIHDKDDTYDWDGAFASKVATLNSGSFAGHNDWRVPNRFELETLVNLGALSPATFSAFNTGCAPACTVTSCSCTQSNGYWSSTTYQYYPSSAWYVYFYDGLTFADYKTGGGFVRVVRGGS